MRARLRHELNSESRLETDAAGNRHHAPLETRSKARAIVIKISERLSGPGQQRCLATDDTEQGRLDSVVAISESPHKTAEKGIDTHIQKMSTWRIALAGVMR